MALWSNFSRRGALECKEQGLIPLVDLSYGKVSAPRDPSEAVCGSQIQHALNHILIRNFLEVSLWHLCPFSNAHTSFLSLWTSWLNPDSFHGCPNLSISQLWSLLPLI